MNTTASSDLLRLLAIAGRAPGESHRRVFAALGLRAPADLAAWRAAHTEAFVTQCVPLVSIYVGDQGAIGGEAADRVAGFRRLLGADPSGGASRGPDDLSEILSDYAELAARAGDPRAAHAKQALLWEHLLCWLTPFCDALTRSAPAPYAGWAAILRDVFLAEARAAGSPAPLPLALRRAPAWAIGFNAESAAAAARALLVPAATGIVLTRADLRRAAAAVRGGPVWGSRALMLRTLFVQDASTTLAWLSDHAAEQAEARAAEIADLGDVAVFWRERARASAGALAALRERGAPAQRAAGGRTRASRADDG